jgi:hypothetical protein
MDASLLIANLLSPPVLFFFLGALAVAVRSDLEVPQPIPKLLSLYLLLSIGFKGGVELRESGDDGGALTALLAATLMSIVVPLYAFAFLRRRLDVNNAAALAAAYGSVSAVTFITASAFLRRIGVPFGGYMVACLALMESPAIIVGVMPWRGCSGTPPAARRGSPGTNSCARRCSTARCWCWSAA